MQQFYAAYQAIHDDLVTRLGLDGPGLGDIDFDDDDFDIDKYLAESSDGFQTRVESEWNALSESVYNAMMMAARQIDAGIMTSTDPHTRQLQEMRSGNPIAYHTRLLKNALGFLVATSAVPDPQNKERSNVGLLASAHFGFIATHSTSGRMPKIIEVKFRGDDGEVEASFVQDLLAKIRQGDNPGCPVRGYHAIDPLMRQYKRLVEEVIENHPRL